MSSVVAKTYADALFQLCKNENCLDEVYEELKVVNSVVDTTLLKFLANPSINKKDKITVVQSSFNGLNVYLVNFFKILVQKNRFLKIKEIKKAFDTAYYEEKGILEAYLYTAIDLSSEQMDQIKQTFEKKYNKQILVHLIKDESLIAGVKVKINDDVYDNTLVNQLRLLKEKV